MSKRKTTKPKRCADPLKKLAAAVSWGAMANAQARNADAAKLPPAPQLAPSRQLLPAVNYES